MPAEIARVDTAALSPEVTEWDQEVYDRITSTTLTPEQAERIVTPTEVYPRQTAVFGVHWHPEFVPMELITRRVATMFPNATSQLLVPTQHNVLMELDGFAGVEVDAYAAGFNRKVQFLVHFTAARVQRADTFRAMLSHTYRYRASQLYEFIDTIVDPRFEERVEQAAAKTGAASDLVHFCRLHVTKLKTLIEQNEARTEPDMLKNKLIRFYFAALADRFPRPVIDRAQVFLNAVKQIVKAQFSLRYFYSAQEIIEEVRALGGGLVIPHPEQFWPVLLADFDVDGIEVWNPQSREYTEFLVHCVTQQNRTTRRGQRRLLITMGDDTHFGEKVLAPQHQDAAKASRELGVQPAWDDLAIRKALTVAGADRASLIQEYKARLA
ncbi:MAG: hypothetical protein IPM18_13310 [Phycisphaerales bacterium]|nr:hypothetical protein [Phycisphaerales bacterium]